jgi:hypothetical protein
LKKITAIVLLAMIGIAVRNSIAQLDERQLMLLIGMCFGLLAGIPIGISALPTKQRAKQAPKMWVEVDGNWEEIDRNIHSILTK